MWLVRKRGTKAKAHVWTGTDTACRMASTGGLKLNRFDVREDRGDYEICHMCKEKAESPSDLKTELELKVRELWKAVKPSDAAQRIRSKLSSAFDSEKSKSQWLGDHAPDYVWDLVDIAAQWGIEEEAKAKRNS